MKRMNCLVLAWLLFALPLFAQNGELPAPVRIDSGVSGHIHPVLGVTRKGTLVGAYCKSEYKPYLITRSTDGGKTWSRPILFPPTEKTNLYPGSLTTLADGRLVHTWNVWYEVGPKLRSRYVAYSISSDDGVTWSEPKNLAKSKDEKIESVIRHPIVELSADAWLFPLMDRTVVYNPRTGAETPFGDGRNHGLVPIVRTAKGTLISGKGLRSTDGGKTWSDIKPFPDVSSQGWRQQMIGLKNGWLLASQSIGPGVGGDKIHYIVSRDDGRTWDLKHPVEFYNPGRAIGGRACPRSVEIDDRTLGTIFYDVDVKQPGGAGVFFRSLPIARLAGPGRPAERVRSDRFQARSDAVETTTWYDIRKLDLEGQGWKEDIAPFGRLPAKASNTVRQPVWGLSRHSAGLCVRFVTDATEIEARWTLLSNSLAMPHMPATGVSGLDLYVKTDNGWRWLSVGRPTKQTTQARLVSGIPPGKREYLLYLPLYNGVSSVEIGIPRARALAKAPPRSKGRDKPIVFYGTSITQGGCASRPGMVHTAIVGRKLDYAVINLGFSGNGRMEPELADLLAEVDAAAYVLDCLPNMGPKDVTERVEPFVRTLRKTSPDTPILLVEDRSYANGFLVAAQRQRNEGNRQALRAAHERLRKAGIENLHYLRGEELLGADGEDTVDASHPTDLGFLRQAEAFTGALRPILAK